MSSLLEVKDLRISFKQKGRVVHAVRGINFNINRGETVAIVGESGCGKTVAAKSLLKLISTPSFSLEEGKALYNGTNLLSLPEREIRKFRGLEISMIFQDPMTSLNPTMKIGKQILEGIFVENPKLPMHEATKKAIELLKLVGVPSPHLRSQQYPHQLSGGMRQRVMIAIALSTSPKILIADEPTTALDVTIQAQILDLLKEIQQKTGTSILFITHDLSLVASFADRVLVMYAGEIIESASTSSIFSAPSHPYTKRLLKAIPRVDRGYGNDLHPIEGQPPRLSHAIPGCAFCSRCWAPMNICSKQHPPNFLVEDGHSVACWLQDLRAKRINTSHAEATDRSQEPQEALLR